MCAAVGKNCVGAMSKKTGNDIGDCLLGMQPGTDPNSDPFQKTEDRGGRGT